MKRVAIYIRVSTEEQKTDMQRDELLKFAFARNWKGQIYEDLGVSGTTANRPALKKLLSDVRSRKVDVVLCWKLDRLFRSLKHLVVTLQEFEELGVQFVSLKDNIDLTTSSGRLMMHMLGAFAEFEASLIKERIKSGLASAVSKGKILGRPKARGERDKEIADYVAQGHSWKEAAQHFNLHPSSVQRAIEAVRSKG